MSLTSTVIFPEKHRAEHSMYTAEGTGRVTSLRGQSRWAVRTAAPGRGPRPGGAPGPLGTGLALLLVCGRLRAGFGL